MSLIILALFLVLLGRLDGVEAFQCTYLRTSSTLTNHRMNSSTRPARCFHPSFLPIPLFGSSSDINNNKDEEPSEKKNSIGFSGLLQLITAG